jgi:hypothetical protein
MMIDIQIAKPQALRLRFCDLSIFSECRADPQDLRATIAAAAGVVPRDDALRRRRARARWLGRSTNDSQLCCSRGVDRFVRLNADAGDGFAGLAADHPQDSCMRFARRQALDHTLQLGAVAMLQCCRQVNRDPHVVQDRSAAVADLDHHFGHFTRADRPAAADCTLHSRPPTRPRRFGRRRLSDLWCRLDVASWLANWLHIDGCRLPRFSLPDR